MSIAKAFKTVTLALGGMVLVFFAVGAVLSPNWQMENSRLVAAPPEKILQLIGDWDSWEKWSTMKVALGPHVQRKVEGKPGTIGHRVAWTGSEGSASLALTKVDSEGVAYDFRSRWAGDAQEVLAARGWLHLQPEAGGTLVTWHDSGEWDGLWGRWIGWFGDLQERVRTLQTTSLGGLQAAVAPPLPGDIEEPKKSSK